MKLQYDQDLYADDLDFKTSPISPISGEAAYQPVEAPDICDLDQQSDYSMLSVYDANVQNHVQEEFETLIDYPVAYKRSDNTRDQLTDALNVCFQDLEDTCRSWGIPRVTEQTTCQIYPDTQPTFSTLPVPVSSARLGSSGSISPTLSSYSDSDDQPESHLAHSQTTAEQMTCQIYPDTQLKILTLPVPVSPARSGSSGSISPALSSYSDSDDQPETPPAHSQTTDDTDRLPEEPGHHHRQTIQLWQFLKLLLLDGHYTDCIRWVDRSCGIFRIENSERVARLWGKRKNCPAMDYDKLSRSLRTYYNKNIIKKTNPPKRLEYQFCQM